MLAVVPLLLLVELLVPLRVILHDGQLGQLHGLLRLAADGSLGLLHCGSLGSVSCFSTCTVGMDSTSTSIANLVTFTMTVFSTAHSFTGFLSYCWVMCTSTFTNLASLVLLTAANQGF